MPAGRFVTQCMLCAAMVCLAAPGKAADPPRDAAVSRTQLFSSLAADHQLDADAPGFATVGEISVHDPCASLPKRPWPRWPELSGHFTGGVWLGSVDGHLQTPTGGELGTTSSHRPRTDEIGLSGLEWIPSLDAGLWLWSRHEIHVNYFRAGFSGSDVLGEPLISQGQTFPAGAPVHGDLDLDLVRIGYRPHHWTLCLGGWSVVPEAGVAIGHFDYRLRSALGSGPVDRAYSMIFPYLGLLLERSLTERLHLELDFAGSGGINSVSFIDTDLRLVHQLVQRANHDLSLVVGLRGTWLRRHDTQQPAQNDPNLRLGAFSDDPWGGLTLGLRYSF